MARTPVSINTRDGQCPASVFRPDSGQGPWPAVVFFMDGIGIRPALFAMAERLASHGYLVLLPDFFYRAGPYEPQSAASVFGDPERRAAWVARYMATATAENVRSDVEACLAYLDSLPEVKGRGVGAVGYCLGGRLALGMAGYFPDRVVACASYHGARLAQDSPDSPHLLAPRIKARVYVAGAVEDATFPDDMKARLEAALGGAGVDHTIETYEGARHGFAVDDLPTFDKAASERHWQTLLALFGATLEA